MPGRGVDDEMIERAEPLKRAADHGLAMRRVDRGARDRQNTIGAAQTLGPTIESIAVAGGDDHPTARGQHVFSEPKSDSLRPTDDDSRRIVKPAHPRLRLAVRAPF